MTPKIFGIWSNISPKLLELETSNLVHGFVWRMTSSRTKISPKSGRGLGHVTPTIFGSMVGYPSRQLGFLLLTHQLESAGTTAVKIHISHTKAVQPARAVVTCASVCRSCTGLSMRHIETTPLGIQYFVFEHSKFYQKVQFEFLDAVESLNPQNVVVKCCCLMRLCFVLDDGGLAQCKQTHCSGSARLHYTGPG